MCLTLIVAKVKRVTSTTFLFQRQHSDSKRRWQIDANGNVNLPWISSMAAPEVVVLITSCAASDKRFVNVTFSSYANLSHKQPMDLYFVLSYIISHRLHGSYEACDGLNTPDVLVDLTGGVGDSIDMPIKAPKGLFEVMTVLEKMNTIMACTIPVSGGHSHTCQGYPGYFQEPHWKSIGLPEISRVTWQSCISCKIYQITLGIDRSIQATITMSVVVSQIPSTRMFSQTFAEANSQENITFFEGWLVDFPDKGP